MVLTNSRRSAVAGAVFAAWSAGAAVPRTPPASVAAAAVAAAPTRAPAAAAANEIAPPPPWTAALDEVRRLVRAGAPDLALTRVDHAQPDHATAPAEWVAWEEVRFDILQARRDWRTLAVRAAALPEDVPETLRLRAIAVHADALLELNQAEAALSVARGALFKGAAVPADATLDRARRQVVRAYAGAGR